MLGAYLKPGDVLGYEPMGIVEEVGSDVTGLRPGDRVVIPFNISCGSCWMCQRQLYAQCETTQVRDQGKGASLFGYTSLYGSVPGGQAEYLRVPQAQFGPIKVPDSGPDERYLYLSDILPHGLAGRPVCRHPARVGRHLGAGRAIGLDRVPERPEMARRHGIEVIDVTDLDDVPGALIELVDGRGPDAVIDAVGMEAHGTGPGELAQTAAGLLPDAMAQKMMDRAGVDRLSVLHAAVKAVRRGGTVSISGVYGGELDPMPLMEMFDRGIQLRMGQCHVRRWIDEITPLLAEAGDPLGVEDLRTHRLPLDQAATGYEMFQQKKDGCVKVVLAP